MRFSEITLPGSADVSVSPGRPSQDTFLEGCGTPPALCRDMGALLLLSSFRPWLGFSYVKWTLKV